MPSSSVEAEASKVTSGPSWSALTGPIPPTGSSTRRLLSSAGFGEMLKRGTGGWLGGGGGVPPPPPTGIARGR